MFLFRVITLISGDKTASHLLISFNWIIFNRYRKLYWHFFSTATAAAAATAITSAAVIFDVVVVVVILFLCLCLFSFADWICAVMVLMIAFDTLGARPHRLLRCRSTLNKCVIYTSIYNTQLLCTISSLCPEMQTLIRSQAVNVRLVFLCHAQAYIYYVYALSAVLSVAWDRSNRAVAWTKFVGFFFVLVFRGSLIITRAAKLSTNFWFWF